MSNLKAGTKYQWAEDAVFTLTSKEFSTLYNGLTNIVASPVFQQQMQKGTAIIQLHQLMNGMLDAAVGTGIAYEATESVVTADVPA